jgi:nitrite reductase/ring-hydroxylating ferredoxin subunit
VNDSNTAKITATTEHLLQNGADRMPLPDRTVIPLDQLDRRHFCKVAAGCAIATAVGCTAGPQPIEIGSLTDADPSMPPPPPPIDAAPGQPDAHIPPGQPDAHMPPPPPPIDAAVPPMGTCTAGPSYTDCGAPSAFTSGNATYFSSGDFFVVRDAGGLYAVSSICTHAGCTLTKQSGHFYCPCHGAKFNYDGSIISGPVFMTLVHFVICLLSSGHVGVDPNTTTSTSTRLVA